MSAALALVSCVKTKRAAPAEARDLYTSPLFRGMRRYAEAHAESWYVLSAEHGLVAPTAVIAPYERTLNRMPASERAAWAAAVCARLADVVAPGDEVLVLAGVRYREHVADFLRRRGCAVTTPLAGLPFGAQLRWLKAATRPA